MFLYTFIFTYFTDFVWFQTPSEDKGFTGLYFAQSDNSSYFYPIFYGYKKINSTNTSLRLYINYSEPNNSPRIIEINRDYFNKTQTIEGTNISLKTTIELVNNKAIFKFTFNNTNEGINSKIQLLAGFVCGYRNPTIDNRHKHRLVRFEDRNLFYFHIPEYDAHNSGPGVFVGRFIVDLDTELGWKKPQNVYIENVDSTNASNVDYKQHFGMNSSFQNVTEGLFAPQWSWDEQVLYANQPITFGFQFIAARNSIYIDTSIREYEVGKDAAFPLTFSCDFLTPGKKYYLYYGTQSDEKLMGLYEKSHAEANSTKQNLTFNYDPYFKPEIVGATKTYFSIKEDNGNYSGVVSVDISVIVPPKVSRLFSTEAQFNIYKDIGNYTLTDIKVEGEKKCNLILHDITQNIVLYNESFNLNRTNYSKLLNLTFPVSDLNYGSHKINIIFYEYDKPSNNDTLTYDFYIKYKTSLSDISVTPFNHMLKGKEIHIKGNITDLDNEYVTIYARFNNNNPSTTNVSLESVNTTEFDITMKLPEIVSGQYKITFSAMGSDNQTIDINDSIDIWIVDPPSIKFEQLNNSYYPNNANVTLNYNITDSSNGAVNLTIELSNYTILIPNITPDNYSSNVEINVSLYGLKYRTEGYNIKASLKNCYDIVNDNTETGITLYIRNKPIINAIDAKKVISRGTNSLYLTINFTDYDNDKNLNLYCIKDNNGIKLGETQSSTNPNQTKIIELKDEKFKEIFKEIKKYNLNFVITSANDLTDNDTNQRSDNFPFEIEYKEQPVVKILQLNNTSYKNDDNVSVIFEVTDNTNGTIVYKFNGENHSFNYSISTRDNSAVAQNFTQQIHVNKDILKFNKNPYQIEFICGWDINQINVTCSNKHVQFKVINPTIISSVSVPPLLISDEKTIEINISVNFTDVDENKTLNAIINNDNTKSIKLTSNGSENQSIILTYYHKTDTGGKKDIPISVKLIYDDNGEHKESNVLSTTFNISKPPQIRFDEHAIHDRTYKYGDLIEINSTIDDETFGIINFYINGKKYSEQQYNVSDNAKITLNFNVTEDIKYQAGSYNLTIQASDEYQTNSIENETFSFYIRNPPTIDKLQVSNNTVVSDDQIIYVTGTFKDIDKDKNLSFYQHIEGRTKIDDVLLGSDIKSKGTDGQTFNFTLMNLDRLETGEYQIFIYATDKESKRYSKSNNISVNITNINNPNISIEFPPTNVLNKNSNITLKFNVRQSDEEGTFVVSLVNLSKETPDTTHVINYSYSTASTFERTLQLPYDYGSYKLIIKAEGKVFTSSANFDWNFFIRHSPKLTSFSFNPTTAGNGDQITFNYLYTDDDWNKELYFYYKIGQTIRYLGNQRSRPSNSQSFSFPTRLIEFDVSGKTSITGWIQSIHKENPTELLAISNNITQDFNYTSPPSLEKRGSLKQFYGYNETVSISVSINDESSGLVNVKFGETIVHSAPYTTSRGSAKLDMEFTFNNTFRKEQTVKVQIIDEFNRSSEINYGSFTIRNKPHLESVTITPPNVLISESLNIEGIFNYADEGKKVNMKAKLQDKVVFDPVINVTQSTGSNNQKYRWSLPLSQFNGLNPGTDYNIEFWLVTEEYVQKEGDYDISTDILNRSTSEKIGSKFRISFTPNITIDGNSVMNYYNSTKNEFNVSGLVQGDGKVTIYAIYNGQESVIASDVQASQNGNQFGPLKFNFSSENSYGEKLVIFRAVDANSKNSSDVFMKFFIKNQPTLSNITVSPNPAFLGDWVTINGTVTDLDKAKQIYVHIKYGANSAITIPNVVSGQPFSTSIRVNNIGIESFMIFASDNSNPNFTPVSEFDKSEIVNNEINVSSKPILYFSNPPGSNYFHHKDRPLVLKVRVSDDKTVRCQYTLNGEPLEGISKTYELNGQTVEEDVHIPISDLKYGEKYTIEVKLNDTFGFVSEYIHSYDFYIKTKPTLENITNHNPVLLKGENISITGIVRCEDRDRKMYVHIRYGDNIYYTIKDIVIGNQFKATIPEVGLKIMKFYVFASENPDPRFVPLTEMDKSNTTELSSIVTFKPTINLIPPYNDDHIFNSKRDLVLGIEVTSDTDFIVNYMLNNTNLTDISGFVQKSPYIFVPKYIRRTINISKIPSSYTNDLTISVVDMNGYKSVNELNYWFIVKNKPVLTNVTFLPNPVIFGENLTIKGIVQDPDDNEHLYVHVRSNDYGTSYDYATKQVKPEEQFSVSIIANRRGTNSIWIVVNEFSQPNYDTDNYFMKSDEKRIVFNVTSKPELNVTYPTGPRYFHYNYRPLIVEVSAVDDREATLKINVNNTNVVSMPINFNDKRLHSNITIPLETIGTRYGEVYSLTVSLVDSYGVEAASVEPYLFEVKDKPNVRALINQTTVIQGQYFQIKGFLLGYDSNRKYYAHVKIGDSYTNFNASESSYTSLTFVRPFKADSLGSNEVLFWVSDSSNPNDDDPSGLSSSKKWNFSIYVTKMPELIITEKPSGNSFSKDEKLKFKCKVSSYTTAKVQIYLGTYPLKELFKTGQFNDKDPIEIIVPIDKLNYAINYTLSFNVVDDYGYASENEMFHFSIRNKPEITSITFAVPFVNAGYSAKVSGVVKDLDRRKLLHLYIIDNDDSKYVGTVSSNGGSRNFEFDVHVDANTAASEKSYNFLFSDSNPLDKSAPDSSRSKQKPAKVVVTFAPQLTYTLPKTEFFESGKSIDITGSITADNFVTMKYKVDEDELAARDDIGVRKKDQEFQKSVPIPSKCKKGIHDLYVTIIDKYDQMATVKETFYIKNKPVLSDVHISKTQYTKLEVVTVSGKVFDRDAGDDLNFYVQFGEAKEVLASTMKSSGVEEDFSFEIRVPADLEYGNASIKVHVTDVDRLTSENKLMKFEVVVPARTPIPTISGINKQEDNKPNSESSSSSHKAFIAAVGVACFILLCLFLLFIVYKVKVSRANNPQEQPDNQETVTSTGNDQRTMDNPMSTRSKNKEIFSDDDEEINEQNFVMV